MLDEANLQKGELKALAKILMKMQESKNDGEGVAMVRTIANFLRRGEVALAKNTARVDSDKLWSYPEIRRFIHDMIEPIGYMDENTGYYVND